jgi:hypothetical protein
MFSALKNLFTVKKGSAVRRKTNPFRPTLEELEPREVLSSPQVGVFLAEFQWQGIGQVSMRVTGQQGQWQSNSYTDPGTRPSVGAWTFSGSNGGQAEADPVAYVGNSVPSLSAHFMLDWSDASVKTLQIRASATDGFIQFLSPQFQVTQPRIVETLRGQNTVGNVVSDRPVTLQWSERVNGGPWQPISAINTTSQRLFVTYATALSPAVNHTTAVRMDCACTWAIGVNCSHNETNIMAIANAIDKFVMPADNWDPNIQAGEGEKAWSDVVNTGEIKQCQCVDLAWLMSDALGELGIWSQVRCVYPRTVTWAGLYGANPGLNQYRTGAAPNTNAWLGYIGDEGEWENYEGCCFVHAGLDQRYYLAGFTTVKYESSAFAVWNYETKGGKQQAWMDDYSKWYSQLKASGLTPDLQMWLAASAKGFHAAPPPAGPHPNG